MIGVDEVGRGCWAGPLLVVAARQTAPMPDGLRDSKFLSRQQRHRILDLLSNCCEFGEGWVTAAEIDRSGLAEALRTGARRALIGIAVNPDEEITIDGNVNYAPKKFRRSGCLVRADSVLPIVSAASIYAKVQRDRHMAELSDKYPGYGFEKHVGYGTARHKSILQDKGAIRAVHRMSFKPLLALKGQS
jgi:ribonuclease HII